MHSKRYLVFLYPPQELMQLVMESGSFDWLDAKEEDVYSIEDGEGVKWSREYSEHIS
jgi:hypothetical protein